MLVPVIRLFHDDIPYFAACLSLTYSVAGLPYSISLTWYLAHSALRAVSTSLLIPHYARFCRAATIPSLRSCIAAKEAATVNLSTATVMIV